MNDCRSTLPNLVALLHKVLSDDDKRFLLALKQGTQDWKKFPLPEVERLPAIQWKIQNLARMKPTKRRQAITKLEKILFGQYRRNARSALVESICQSE